MTEKPVESQEKEGLLDKPVAEKKSNVPGPGALLRHAREKQHLDIAELCSQVKLSKANYIALEADDFATLSEPVYVRGYYRRCANVLKIDEKSLLAAYERVAVPPEPKVAKPASNFDREPVHINKGGVGRWIVTILVLGALGLLVSYFMQESPLVPGSSGEGPEAVVLLPPSTDNSGVAEEFQTDTPGTRSFRLAPQLETPAGSDTQTPQDEAVDNSGGVTEPTQTETLTPPPPSRAEETSRISEPAPVAEIPRGTLTLTVNADCWVRIEDANGRRLVSGLLSAGDDRTVRGPRPYTVFLGNAPAAVIRYNGEVVDLKAFTKDNNTASLSVPTR